MVKGKMYPVLTLELLKSLIWGSSYSQFLTKLKKKKDICKESDPRLGKPIWLIRPMVIFGFIDIKRLRIFLFPLDRMPVHRRFLLSSRLYLFVLLGGENQ